MLSVNNERNTLYTAIALDNQSNVSRTLMMNKPIVNCCSKIFNPYKYINIAGEGLKKNHLNSIPINLF